MGKGKKKDINNKVDEITDLEKSRKTRKVLREFLKRYGEKIIEMAIQYRQENGLGALFVTLIPNSTELDAEYFKLEDLDGHFQKKINDNPDHDNIAYYAVRLYKSSYIFEKKLDQTHI